MHIQPYLFFEGRCEEALAYYREALGAEVTALLRYRDGPPGACGEGGTPAEMADKVMHAKLRIGDSQVMASDGHCEGDSEFRGFSLTLNAPDAAEAERRFRALAEGGRVQMPLGETFFSPCFGMVTDRLGVSWMVIVPA